MMSPADALRSTPPLRDQLRRRFEEQPERPALYVEAPPPHGSGRWLSYGDLGRGVYRTAHALTAAGVVPGARVGVLLPNGEPFVCAWLALALLNAAMVPINVQLIGAGLRHVVEQSDPHLLLADPALAPALYAAFDSRAPAPQVYLTPRPPSLEGRGRDLRGGNPLPLPLKEGGRGVRSAPDVPADPADDALIIFTSGTTGPSKGVVLSRTAQLWHGLNYLRDFIQLGPGETGYTPLPLSHVSAQGFTLGCLLGGAAVVIGSRFQPFSFWRTVRRHRVRAFNYVGAMVPLLYHRPPREDDRDNPVERAVGSATAPELHEAFERRFGLRLIESYGQTELAGLWLTDPPEGRRIGTAGKPREWLEAAVLRPDGSAAGIDEPGEIAVRPMHPLLMTQGYFRDPDATARAFHDGWYHTGDSGSRDADGYFRFQGRLKDFIRRRGENISALEIEREALTHPAVREAAAVGVPSPLGEEEVKLCVILHDGATLDPGALDRHLRGRLAPFMRPRYIEVRADFPRTPTQRVQKFVLADEGITGELWEAKAHAKAQRRKDVP